MSAEPKASHAGALAGSILDVIRRWRVLRKVEKELEAGKAKHALECLQGFDDNVPFCIAQARALTACGRPGAARKTVREAIKRWEGQLQDLLKAGDKAQLEEAMRERKPVPVHLLGDLPRHVPGSFLLDDIEIHFPDGPSAGSAYQEIYKKRMYEFHCDHPPRIIDGGANIGLATLFLKSRHPAARVTCFEADPGVATYLRKNLAAARLNDVEVVEAALWECETVLEFSSEGSDAGRVNSSSGEVETTRVKGVRLSPCLTDRVDFLKLDIEGAELAVLRECQAKLGNVQRLFVEYHSFENQPQGLPELLAIMQGAGFRIAVTVSDVLSPRPLLERGSNLGMDMRLNLFGVRTGD